MSLCRHTGPVPGFGEDLERAGEVLELIAFLPEFSIFSSCFPCILWSFLAHTWESRGSWQWGNLPRGKLPRCKNIMLILWLHVHMNVMPAEAKSGCWVSWSWTYSCLSATWHVFRELNLGTLLWTTEPYLQRLYYVSLFLFPTYFVPFYLPNNPCFIFMPYPPPPNSTYERKYAIPVILRLAYFYFPIASLLVFVFCMYLLLFIFCMYLLVFVFVCVYYVWWGCTCATCGYGDKLFPPEHKGSGDQSPVIWLGNKHL